MKRQRRKWILLILALAAATAAWAASTYTTVRYRTESRALWTQHLIAVTSGTAGTATWSGTLHGTVRQINTVPGSGGDAPSSSWGCKLTDAYSGDVLGGAIWGNRSASVAETAYPLSGSLIVAPRIDGLATLTCSTLGDTNKATVVLVTED